MIRWVIVAVVVVWLAGAVLAWALCVAAGRADRAAERHRHEAGR